VVEVVQGGVGKVVGIVVGIVGCMVDGSYCIGCCMVACKSGRLQPAQPCFDNSLPYDLHLRNNSISIDELFRNSTLQFDFQWGSILKIADQFQQISGQVNFKKISDQFQKVLVQFQSIFNRVSISISISIFKRQASSSISMSSLKPSTQGQASRSNFKTEYQFQVSKTSFQSQNMFDAFTGFPVTGPRFYQ